MTGTDTKFQPNPAATVDRMPPSPRPTHRVPWRSVAILLAVVLTGFSLIGFGLIWSGSSDTATSVVATSSGEEAVALAGETTADTVVAQETATETSESVAVAESVALVDVSDVVSDVVDSVVTVEVMGNYRGRETVIGTASGVIVGSDGMIVTNAHVVEEATSLNVILTDGSDHEATIVLVDTGSDVALIDIDVEDLNAIELGSTDGLEVGDPVIAIGNPLGLEGGPSVSTGIVSALGRVLEDSDVSLDGVIQTDAAITEGSSGGALLDARGHLVGITTAIGVSSVGVEGIGFAIPVETVVSVMATAGNT